MIEAKGKTTVYFHEFENQKQAHGHDLLAFLNLNFHFLNYISTSESEFQYFTDAELSLGTTVQCPLTGGARLWGTQMHCLFVAGTGPTIEYPLWRGAHQRGLECTSKVLYFMTSYIVETEAASTNFPPRPLFVFRYLFC